MSLDKMVKFKKGYKALNEPPYEQIWDEYDEVTKKDKSLHEYIKFLKKYASYIGYHSFSMENIEECFLIDFDFVLSHLKNNKLILYINLDIFHRILKNIGADIYKCRYKNDIILPRSYGNYDCYKVNWKKHYYGKHIPCINCAARHRFRKFSESEYEYFYNTYNDPDVLSLCYDMPHSIMNKIAKDILTGIENNDPKYKSNIFGGYYRCIEKSKDYSDDDLNLLCSICDKYQCFDVSDTELEFKEWDFKLCLKDWIEDLDYRKDVIITNGHLYVFTNIYFNCITDDSELCISGCECSGEKKKCYRYNRKFCEDHDYLCKCLSLEDLSYISNCKNDAAYKMIDIVLRYIEIDSVIKKLSELSDIRLLSHIKDNNRLPDIISMYSQYKDISLIEHLYGHEFIHNNVQDNWKLIKDIFKPCCEPYIAIRTDLYSSKIINAPLTKTGIIILTILNKNAYSSQYDDSDITEILKIPYMAGQYKRLSSIFSIEESIIYGYLFTDTLDIDFLPTTIEANKLISYLDIMNEVSQYSNIILPDNDVGYDIFSKSPNYKMTEYFENKMYNQDDIDAFKHHCNCNMDNLSLAIKNKASKIAKYIFENLLV